MKTSLKKFTTTLMLATIVSTSAIVTPITNFGTIKAEACVTAANVSLKKVQNALNNFYVAYYKAHGKYPWHGGKLAVDGICGSRTEFAIASFQKDSGLKLDGIVGPVTWKSLAHYDY